MREYSSAKGIAMAQSKKKYKVTGKKTASSRSSGTSRSQSSRNTFKKNSGVQTVLGQFVPFILFIVAVLLTISFFVRDFGAVGNFIRDNLLFGIFSVSLYLLPLLLVFIGGVLLSDRDYRSKRNKIWCAVCAFLLVDVICHLLFAPSEW